MPLSLKKNNALTTSLITVIGITVNCKNVCIVDVLNELRIFHKENILIRHPINEEKIQKLATSYNGIVYYIEPSKILNQLFQHANILDKISFIDIIGISINIDRNSYFRDAVNYYKFCDILKARGGIVNPSWMINDNGIFEESIRRIHVIQLEFLDDPEIFSGLNTTYSKNTDNDKVLYVCSEELLALALQCCSPGITLIIDGHWEQDKFNDHGCWEHVSSTTIAMSLKRLVTAYPEKISAIRLFGCESGKIARFSELSEYYNPDNLIFKDDCLSSFHDKDMSKFRNRAIYYTSSNESPWAANSLAAEIMHHLPTVKRISGVPSYGYPFPWQGKSLYNIGSDSMVWRGEQYWNDNELMHTLGYPKWYKKLHHLKSITVIRGMPDNLDQWPSKR